MNPMQVKTRLEGVSVTEEREMKKIQMKQEVERNEQKRDRVTYIYSYSSKGKVGHFGKHGLIPLSCQENE